MGTRAQLVRPAVDGGAGAGNGLSALEGLRRLTREAHWHLDRDLGLLSRPLSPERFHTVLGRLLGFFRIWEPAVSATPAAQFLGGGSRVPLLEADLSALGTTPAQIAALPDCRPAAGLGCSPGAALGSLYVLEGSRQGGRVIRGALRDETWLPVQGLRYFEDGGPSADAAWRRLTDGLGSTGWDRADPEIGAGALATFAVLRSWLTGPAAS